MIAKEEERRKLHLLSEHRQARDLADLCEQLAHNLRVGRLPGWLCTSITPSIRIASKLVQDFLARGAGAAPLPRCEARTG